MYLYNYTSIYTHVCIYTQINLSLPLNKTAEEGYMRKRGRSKHHMEHVHYLAINLSVTVLVPHVFSSLGQFQKGTLLYFLCFCVYDLIRNSCCCSAGLKAPVSPDMPPGGTKSKFLMQKYCPSDNNLDKLYTYLWQAFCTFQVVHANLSPQGLETVGSFNLHMNLSPTGTITFLVFNKTMKLR